VTQQQQLMRFESHLRGEWKRSGALHRFNIGRHLCYFVKSLAVANGLWWL